MNNDRIMMKHIEYLLCFLGTILFVQTNAQDSQNKESTINVGALQKEFMDPPAKYRMLQITHQAKMDGTLDSLKKY
jgi:hypothetical protein